MTESPKTNATRQTEPSLEALLSQRLDCRQRSMLTMSGVEYVHDRIEELYELKDLQALSTGPGLGRRGSARLLLAVGKHWAGVLKVASGSIDVRPVLKNGQSVTESLQDARRKREVEKAKYDAWFYCTLATLQVVVIIADPSKVTLLLGSQAALSGAQCVKAIDETRGNDAWTQSTASGRWVGHGVDALSLIDSAYQLRVAAPKILRSARSVRRVFRSARSFRTSSRMWRASGVLALELPGLVVNSANLLERGVSMSGSDLLDYACGLDHVPNTSRPPYLSDEAVRELEEILSTAPALTSTTGRSK